MLSCVCITSVSASWLAVDGTETVSSESEKQDETACEQGTHLPSLPPGVNFIHKKCRPLSREYIKTTIKRTRVPDTKVFWEVGYNEYAPVSYTAQKVLSP